MKTPYITPSLACFKADAKSLQKEVIEKKYLALNRLRLSGVRNFENGIYTTCLKVIAKEYGYDHRRIIFNEKLISKYVDHSFAKGYWKMPYEGKYHRARFLLQFDAIVETLREGVPLAKTSFARGVDFSGFHFSSLLFSRVSSVLRKKKLPDFSGIQAPGSLIEMSWLQDVVSLQNVNFRDAKFYCVTCDPLVRPGAHCYRADFSGADLRGVDFRGAYLRGTSFVRAQLDGADFRNSNIYECNFTGTEGQFVTGNVDDEDWYVEPTAKYKAY